MPLKSEAALQPSSEAKAAAPSRIASVDILRGLTILVMVFVNDVSSVKGLPWWTYHAHGRANYMTYVDMVFPAFLFLVGMSIPLAMGRRQASESAWKTFGHVLLRSAGLLVLGLFLANSSKLDPQLSGISHSAWALLGLTGIFLGWNVYPRGERRKTLYRALKIAGFVILAVVLAIFRRKTPTGDVAWLSFSYWEILGLIGWAYMAVATLYLLARKKPWMMPALLVVLSAMNVASTALHPAQAWPFLRQVPFEAGLCAITMAGVVASMIFFHKAGPSRLRDKILWACAYGAALLLAGWLLAPLGISKNRDTPTWGLLSAGTTTFLFLALYWLADVKRHTRWAALVKPAGANTLTTYLLPDVWYATPLLATLGARWSAGAPGVIKSFVFTGMILALAALFTRWKVRLQL